MTSSLSGVDAESEIQSGAHRPKVSIVIATWNRRQRLLDTLHHVCSEAEPIREVIVVDNASTDGTIEAVAAAFPQVRLLRLPWNSGHTGAANAGAAVAEGEYLVMIDDDSFPEEGAISSACELLDKDPLLGAVAGNVYTPSERRWDMTRFFDPLPKEPREVPWFVGCGVVIRKDLFTKLHGYNERLVFYWEEEDFSFRLWQSGHRIAFHPAARFVHLRSPENRSNARFMFLLTRNGLWFIRGAYRGWQAARFCFVLALLNGSVAVRSHKTKVLLAFLDGLRHGVLEPAVSQSSPAGGSNSHERIFTRHMERFFGLTSVPRKISARVRRNSRAATKTEKQLTSCLAGEEDTVI